MAIHPAVPRDRSRQSNLTGQQALDISAWTEQTAASLQSLDISDSADEIQVSSTIRGTSTALSIPLDDPIPTKAETSSPRVKIIGKLQEENGSSLPSGTYRRREPIRRDSLKRRESLLKGKEGSRRRQRWENARLLTNPWAQPPAPSDWFVQPTHTRHDPLPYYLAPLWDAHYAHKEESKSFNHSRRAKDKDDEKSRVSKEVRQSLKHARAARGMLQDLEEDVRQFLEKWNERQLLLREGKLQTSSAESDLEDSDEEIVFVGRNGQMYDSPGRKVPSQRLDEGEENGEKLVFESLAHDRGAVFGRWLVHSIATYYGLYTWSVTDGNPARRKAYVGLHPPSTKDHRAGFSFPSGQPVTCGASLRIKPGEPLPKPLWVQV